MRKELTNEWKAWGIEQEQEYAILTNEMSKAWSGFTVKQYKQFKNQSNELLLPQPLSEKSIIDDISLFVFVNNFVVKQKL